MRLVPRWCVWLWKQFWEICLFVWNLDEIGTELFAERCRREEEHRKVEFRQKFLDDAAISQWATSEERTNIEARRCYVQAETLWNERQRRLSDGATGDVT